MQAIKRLINTQNYYMTLIRDKLQSRVNISKANQIQTKSQP